MHLNMFLIKNQQKKVVTERSDEKQKRKKNVYDRFTSLQNIIYGPLPSKSDKNYFL